MPEKLIRKLGIKEGFTWFLIDAPSYYLPFLQPALPPRICLANLEEEKADFTQVFFQHPEIVEESLDYLKSCIKPNGMIWASWRKMKKGQVVDMKSEQVRTAGLRVGLVDVKVCSVDEIWSGLKFVIRAKNR